MKHANSFFHLFPPPEFLKMPTVGLEIANTAIRFVELLYKKGDIVLGKFGERRIPKGIILSGNILNEKALQEELSLVQREHKLSSVRVLLPEQKGYIFTMRLPNVYKREIRGSIALRLEEYVPIPPDQILFDYDVSSCNLGQKGNSLEISVAAIPSDVVGRYWNILSASGLWPLSFELEAYALQRSLTKPNDCRTFMVVDIGRTHTGVVIISEEIVHFAATIPIGGDTLTQAVSKAVGVSEDQAALIKEKYGLAQRQGKGELFSVLTPVVSALRDEIIKYMDFWKTHHGKEDEGDHKMIKNVILSGGETNTPGIKDYLLGSLKVNVVLGNPWMNTTPLDSYIPELSRVDSLRYATTIGLALGGL